MRLFDNTAAHTTMLRAQTSALSFWKKYRLVAVLGLISACFIYSLMMSQQLTNTFDGLCHQNFHHAGVGELSSGRWALIFADKLVMGFHADPIISILTLILFIAGFVVVLDLFGVDNKVFCLLCLLLFISSSAICNTLSYRYTSFGYGLAYLFAVLSVYAVVKIKNRFAGPIVSGIFLGLSISCYQAYVSVFCIVVVFYIIFLCGNFGTATENDGKCIFRTLFRACGALIISAVFYIASLSLFLKLYQTSMSEYNGIGEMSFAGLLAKLPNNIAKTYLYFGAFFFGDKLKTSRLQSFGVFYVLFALLIVLIIIIAARTWKTQKRYIGILLLAVAAIPFSCNAYMLIAGDKLELQMAIGLAMLMPLTMVIAFTCFKNKFTLKRITALLCVVLLYGNSMQVFFDQEAMYEGQNACETLATQVISDLKNENLLSSDYRYFFVGVPAESPFFTVSDIFYCANAYAQVGNFWVSGYCSQLSYKGLINKRMGFNLTIPYLTYENVSEIINFTEMPSFPNDGYLALMDDHTVVIKISDYKKYTGNSKYVFND